MSLYNSLIYPPHVRAGSHRGDLMREGDALTPFQWAQIQLTLNAQRKKVIQWPSAASPSLSFLSLCAPHSNHNCTHD